MPCYVDPLAHRGWILRGRATASCHLFTDALDLAELHTLAARIGMRRAWFQDHSSAPHYDLTPSRREAAVAAGAIEVDRRRAVAIWRERRILAAADDTGVPPRVLPRCGECGRPFSGRRCECLGVPQDEAA